MGALSLAWAGEPPPGPLLGCARKRAAQRRDAVVAATPVRVARIARRDPDDPDGLSSRSRARLPRRY